jgi:diaminopimelate epimerase
MDVRFTKMHGAGNDFIVVDEWDCKVVPDNQKADFVRSACDRHFGVGSDGAIFVQKAAKHDVNFVFYNPDGSRAEMCGNGIRCLAKYVYEHGLVGKNPIRAESLAGERILELEVVHEEVVGVKVDMGRPQVLRGEAQVAGKPRETFIAQKVKIGKVQFTITSVGMGNPHAIMFVTGLDKIDVRGIGAAIRNHRKVFPNGTNVHFVENVRANEFRVRTFERGVEDETLACGTGICASAVAAVLNKKADMGSQILFHARGGDIRVQLEGTPNDIRKAYLIGPADSVFCGTIPC